MMRQAGGKIWPALGWFPEVPRSPRICSPIFVAPALAVALTASAAGAEAKYIAPVSVTTDSITIEVANDLTYNELERVAYRINDAQGAQQASQIPVFYSNALEIVEVQEAYTTTKDGQRIDVTPDKILSQPLAVNANAPMLGDQRVKLIVFSQIEPGSILTLRYKKWHLKPALPGVLSYHRIFPKTWDFLGTNVTIQAPSALDIHMDVAGLKGGESKPSNPGTRLWHWTLSESDAVAPELGSVDVSDVSPYIAFTNLKGYEALAAAYMTGAKPAAAVTPAIQTMANEITAGLTEPRAQAEALYRWVSGNIRYVAIYLGTGGLVPHSAAEVLASRYGDCKDHVALLQALLEAKGIASSPALVNATYSYAWPSVASLSTFNHVVTYIPSLKLFVDSTTPFAPFGRVSVPLLGKRALVADSGNGKTQVIAIPDGTDTNKEIERRSLVMAADGSFTGTSSIDPHGVFELEQREFLSGIPIAQLPEAVGMMLARVGESGSGSLKFNDPRDLTAASGYEAQYAVNYYAPMPGPGALTTNPGVGSEVDIGTMAARLSAETRALPFPCVGGTHEEITEIALPEALHIMALPRPTNFAFTFGSYQSSYEQTGQTITIKRTLQTRYPHAPCAAADYASIRQLVNAIERDLHTQILYQ
jgi:Domain of Unknown Function with PDB structure (DUF3857)/Transglutaminase-like superfamily